MLFKNKKDIGTCDLISPTDSMIFLMIESITDRLWVVGFTTTITLGNRFTTTITLAVDLSMVGFILLDAVNV